MKVSEIRVKSRQEIIAEIDACKRALVNIRFQWQAGEGGNTANRQGIKKDIARLNTVLREMDLDINTHLRAKE